MSEQPNPLDALDDLIGAVPGHPKWSTTTAADIPRLLAEIDRLRAAAIAVLEGDADGLERLRAALERKE